MATDIAFAPVEIPQDDKPTLDGVPFDSRYPDSTPDAPYGFKPNGEPYRRHHGPGKSTGSATGRGGSRMPASDAQARSAASVLGTLNKLIGMALLPILPGTAVAITEGNDDFEQLAFQALLTDPALCKRILGAGTSSGKAQLFMAYGALGMSVVPTAMGEIKMKRSEREDNSNEQDR